MSPSAKPALGLVVLLVLATLAGCVGVGMPDSPDTETTDAPTTGQLSTTDATEGVETTDTATIETTVSSPSNASARERSLDAEEARVENLLANASNVSGTAGAYGRVEATVLGREEGVVRVRTGMSYSYEYTCDGRSGAVDGKTSEAVYRVTDDAVRLVEVVRGVQLLC